MSSQTTRVRPRPRSRRDELLEKRQDLLLAWSEEVCSSEEVPEVEIVSLLKEHIPKYRLRADSLTEFGGYENQDWFIPSPALPVSPGDLALTPDQIRETLNYFLLCSNRVSQMTKTYNDIEAVTRLLEEKEKDLELTARIGKELLTANGRLEARVTALESELRSARDHITQLRHDLNAKTDLLQVLTNDTEESPTEEESPLAAALRKRTGALERENRALRDEASRLAAGADSAELAERQLLRDIAAQLSSANTEASALASELSDERLRAAEVQYQLESTTSRLTASEKNYQKLNVQHEQTVRILEITKENQNALAAELADVKERYAEVAAHLAEAQEQLRQLRKRGEPVRGLMPSVAAAAGLLPASLHREMHSSVYSELSLDSGIGDPLAHSSMQKVFETVQCASRWSGASLSGSDAADGPILSSLKPPKPPSHDSVLDENSDVESEDLYPGGAGVGVPGAPGAAELAAALRRLTPQEIDSRRASLTASHVLRRYRYTDRDASEESAVWGAGAAGGLARFRVPHKLQIVKPMEGSLTLHTWAQLAKPTMSGLLEDQEGVCVRGSRPSAAHGMRLYRLSDVEEDDDMPRLPSSTHVYTFTNSTVLHPNDGSVCGSSVSSVCSSGMSSLSSSVLGSAWSSRRSSRRSSAAVSPDRSRRDSIHVPPPPARPKFTPTATPANSPLLSPDGSPPSTPRPGEAPSLHALIASGTSILRRRYLTSPAADSSPAPISMQTPGSLYMGLVNRSPMEQLTCLKRTLRSPAAPPIERRESVDAPLGVPAHPGEGALDMSTLGRRPRPRAPRPRTDLGTVGSSPPAASPVTHSSPLGTLSTILFGRKGGLL